MPARVGQLVLPRIERSGPIEARIIDDTRFPQKGRPLVGVSRHYRAQLGKQDNCQGAVSLFLVNHDASLPIADRLYRPEDWARDQARRDKPRVPQTIACQTKPAIAFEQIKAARATGLPEGMGLMAPVMATTPGCGPTSPLPACAASRGSAQHLGVVAGRGPMPRQSQRGRSRPLIRLQRGQHQPISLKTLALSLPQEAWQPITWREGTRAPHPKLDRDPAMTPRRSHQDPPEMPLLQRADP